VGEPFPLLRSYLAAAGAATPSVAERAASAWRSGRVHEAAALAEAALATGLRADAHAEMHLLTARCEVMLGRSAAACERLRTEAAAITDSSPDQAAAMLVEASRAAFMSGDRTTALATAARAQALARHGPPSVRLDAELAVGLARIQVGGEAAEALMERTLQSIATASPDLFTAIHRWSAALLWAEHHDDARSVLERAIEHSRSLRLLELLPIALDTLAAVEFRVGRWSSAEAHSAEALRLNRLRDAPFETASNLTTLARIEAARGNETATTERLREAEQLDPSGGLLLGYAASAAALLELSLGRPDRAVEQLDRIATSAASSFEPGVFRWEADFVEALFRAGRAADARAALDRFAERAGGSTRIWTRASVCRCRGLLASVDDFDLEFDEAMRWHSRSPMPFERARTELCYAERLRRARRTVDARTWFSSALATFEQLGAEPWALRARRGLAGPGRRARRLEPGIPLSPHERQVAALVQRGATNREVAAALFVTSKTIEYHLASIYRKLNIRSRTELSYALSTASPGRNQR
jgi:ATP/maltotriose-dependent transcriptional regulator MalT